VSTRTLAGTALLAAIISSGHAVPLVTASPLVTTSLAAAPQADDTAIRRLLNQLESVAREADVSRYLELLAPTADVPRAQTFAQSEFRTPAARAVIQERDRQPLTGALRGNGYVLIVDAFTEDNGHGRVATWQLDVRRVDDEWRVAALTRISAVENLHRLTLNPVKQFTARNFTITAEDLELTLVDGSVFLCEVNQDVTGLVLIGRGDLRFDPSPETERGQVRIFAGADKIATRFDAAFVRVGNFESHADRSTLQARDVDPRDLRRAEQIFREESVKSFVVDLADLARDTWSLLPGSGDFLAEIRTPRFGTLTYSRSSTEAEDISFFERRRRRNIANYASKARLAARGRFYDEDDLAPIDVLDHDIAIASTPERHWIAGRATMRLRVRATSLSQLTIRLADTLAVKSVVSKQYGRLFSLRVANQDTILVNLPATLLQGSELTVTIEYAGVLAPQPSDRETLSFAQRRAEGVPLDEFLAQPESSYLYSNRSYWYPQAMTSDYATATIEVAVPADFSCVATGVQALGSPQLVEKREPGGALKVYTFTAERPLRYLAFLVARLVRADQWTVTFGAPVPNPSNPSNLSNPSNQLGTYQKLDLMVEANPRYLRLGKELAERAVDIVQFFESLAGDAPYPAFTVALVETELPGGHSPGYFAVFNQPIPRGGLSWRYDPAAFPSYPEFFLAHEIAHQWWGQAVGWRTYHEQWLSEGFAQYFAALYAQKFRGPGVFSEVMRHMRRWAISESDQGPVYLGYRIGHIKSDGRAFRAVIYNKGAAVLHMLRRLVGDDVFFRGVKRFYAASRFSKAGTVDLQLAMEAESGRSLDRFFERWIYGATLPKVSFSYRVEGLTGMQGTRGSGGSRGSEESVVLRFEQAGDVFDLPVTATLRYAEGRTANVVVPVTESVTELRVPLEGKLRSIDIDEDDGTLVEIKVR
jgi:hypothetical protein